LGIDASRVTSFNIKDARRRLLVVGVELGIVANSADNARVLSSAIKNADLSSITAEAGISGATIGAIEVAVKDNGSGLIPAATPAPKKKSSSNVLGIVVGLFVAALTIGLMVAGYIFYKKRGDSKQSTYHLSEPNQSLGNLQPRTTDEDQPTSPAPVALSSESLEKRFRKDSPLSPHTGVRSPLEGTAFSGGLESSPSMPSRGLSLNTAPPPQISDWMLVTTPPGTPPGEPPCEVQNEYVHAQLVFPTGVAPQKSVAEGFGVFDQMFPWQQQQQEAAGGIYAHDASGNSFDARPAHEMRENLEPANESGRRTSTTRSPEGPEISVGPKTPNFPSGQFFDENIFNQSSSPPVEFAPRSEVDEEILHI